MREHLPEIYAVYKQRIINSLLEIMAYHERCMIRNAETLKKLDPVKDAVNFWYYQGCYNTADSIIGYLRTIVEKESVSTVEN